MRVRLRLGMAVLGEVCLCATVLHGQMLEQNQCSHIVKNNMKKTRTDRPDVYATVRDYMFEWSRSRKACVMVVQYRVQQKGKSPEVQIVAVNAVTMQPMEGYKNIFLLPADHTQKIMDATNFLFERYSH